MTRPQLAILSSGGKMPSSRRRDFGGNSAAAFAYLRESTADTDT